MPESPSPNGTPTDTRDARGRFSRGNSGGPGNPHGGDVARHRAALLKSLRESDVAMILRRLRAIVKSGKDADSIAAAREILNRVIGLPVQSDLMERLEQLERRISDRYLQE